MGRRGRRRRGRGQFLAGLNEALRGFGKLKPEQRAAGREDKIEAHGHQRLMLPVDFAQATFGAIAMDRVAHGSARGDNTHARVVRHTGGPHTPSKEKDPAINAAALLANGAEIGIAPQALTGGQAHGWARCGGHFLDDREALTAFTAAISEDCAAAFGGFAGTETDFAGAF